MAKRKPRSDRGKVLRTPATAPPRDPSLQSLSWAEQYEVVLRLGESFGEERVFPGRVRPADTTGLSHHAPAPQTEECSAHTGQNPTAPDLVVHHQRPVHLHRGRWRR